MEQEWGRKLKSGANQQLMEILIKLVPFGENKQYVIDVWNRNGEAEIGIANKFKEKKEAHKNDFLI